MYLKVYMSLKINNKIKTIKNKIIINRNNKDIKDFFPTTNIKTNKLQISNIGRYSVSHPKDALTTANIIASYFKTKNITITDATANNGGNTIAFAKTFLKVQSVEIDKTEYDILVNNLKVYGITNVDTLNEDYTKIMLTLKQDVVFMDPPWGGPSYKKKKLLKLKLGHHFIETLINKLKDKSKLIVLKVPFNYDFSYLFKYSKYTNKFHIYKFKKYVVIVLLNRDLNNSGLTQYTNLNKKQNKSTVNKES
tara:strand:+ start:387 stop:1136 length:750 start_codon:yes stop_codon:yes gene_type:complete